MSDVETDRERPIQCLLVCGMHRSGTSALAGALERAGVNLGQNLMVAQSDDNERGFFEDLDINALNNDFLEDIGFAWDDLRPLQLGQCSPLSLERFNHRLQNQIHSSFPNQNLWATKNPRISLILPLWRRALRELSLNAGCVISVRKTAAIAESLKKRNGFSPLKSGILTLHYYLSAERGSRGIPRAFVGYEELLANPKQVLAELANTLEFQWPNSELSEVQGFVSADLNHHDEAEYSEGVLPQELQETLRELDALLTASAAESDRNFQNDFDGLGQRFKTFLKQYDPLIFESLFSARSEISVLRREMDERSIDVQRHEEGLSEIAITLSEQIESKFQELRVELGDRVDLLFSQMSAKDREVLHEARRNLSDRAEDVDRRLMDQISLRRHQLQDQVESVAAALREEMRLLVRPGGPSQEGGGDSVYQRVEHLVEDVREIKGLLEGQKRSHRGFGRFLYLLKCGLRSPQQIPGWLLRPFNIEPSSEEPAFENSYSDRVGKIKLHEYRAPNISIVLHGGVSEDRLLVHLENLSCAVNDYTFEIILIQEGVVHSESPAFHEIPNLILANVNSDQGRDEKFNQAATLASGEHLLFVDVDLELGASCIESLLETFQEFPQAAAVTGKVLLPNGRLYEAGAILYSNGELESYGGEADPLTPEYSFCRPVNACSSDLLMVRRDAFDEVSGFSGGYYSDRYQTADLLLGLRLLGKHTYFQPVAIASWLEGGAPQPENAEIVEASAMHLMHKWEEELKELPSKNSVVRSAAEYDVKKHAIVLDHRIPTPDQDSGSLRMWNLIEVLQSMGYKVTFVPDNLDATGTYAKRLQSKGVEIIYAPFYGSVVSYLGDAGRNANLAIVSRQEVASKHLGNVRAMCPQATILFDTVDLHFLRNEREAEITGIPEAVEQAKMMRESELSLAKLADRTLVVSSVEADVLRDADPSIEVDVVSNIQSVNGISNRYSQRNGILFIGGFEHPPNVDGVLWFCREIFPKILEVEPGIHFHIIGSKPPAEILELASDQVTVHGYVEDVRPIFESCRLSVAPLRYGAGVKGKVNQSLGFGLPCIVTPIAGEGMHLVDGKDAIIRETAEEFATGLVQAYSDEEVWNTMSANSLKIVAEHFSFEAARDALSRALAAQQAKEPSTRNGEG